MKTFLKKLWTQLLISLSVLGVGGLGVLFIVTLLLAGNRDYNPCQKGDVLFTLHNKGKVIVTCQDKKDQSHVWNEVWSKGVFNWIKQKTIEIDPD